MTEANAVVEQAASGCCGGPAPKEAGEACCVKDAEAKAAGESGCGCEAPKAATPAVAASRCCA